MTVKGTAVSHIIIIIMIIILLLQTIICCNIYSDYKNIINNQTNKSYAETGIYGSNIINSLGDRDKEIAADAQEGTYEYDWKQDDIGEDITCVPDAESAIRICNAIMSGYQKQGYFYGYLVQSVMYETNDNVWIVDYYPDYPPEEIPAGGSYTIAIDKETAQVINAWPGE